MSWEWEHGGRDASGAGTDSVPRCKGDSQKLEGGEVLHASLALGDPEISWS